MNFRRRARITFYVVAFVTFLLAATVAAHYMHPILGIMLGALIGVAVAVPPAALVLCWPVLRVLLWWSVEIVLAVALTLGWVWLNEATSLVVSLLVVALLVGVPAAIGPARRAVWSVVMCLAVRHRLRAAFNSFIIANRQGSLPLILAARPTPAGERVWVWLRPGLALSTMEDQTDKLAVTCWANETRLVRASARFAALLRVDVIHRDPVAHTVGSPLPGMLPDDTVSSVAPTSPGMPPVGGLDLADVPDAVAGTRETSPSRPPRRPRPAAGDRADDARDIGPSNADWA